MTDPTNKRGSLEPVSRFCQVSSIVNRRTVGAAVFVGGLVVSGASLYQPVDQAPTTIYLTVATSGTSGGTSGTSGNTSGDNTSGGTSGGTSGTAGVSSGSANPIAAFFAQIWHATVSFFGGLITSFLGLFFGFRRFN